MFQGLGFLGKNPPQADVESASFRGVLEGLALSHVSEPQGPGSSIEGL